MSKTIEFNSPNDLYLYIVATAQMLAESSLPEAAQKLEQVNGIFYTTGSEWLGDLGLAIRSFEEEYLIPKEIQVRLNVILAHIKKTWPRM